MSILIINKLIWNKETIGYLIIYWTIIFYQFVNNFSELLSCKMNVPDVFYISQNFLFYRQVRKFWLKQKGKFDFFKI